MRGVAMASAVELTLWQCVGGAPLQYLARHGNFSHFSYLKVKRRYESSAPLRYFTLESIYQYNHVMAIAFYISFMCRVHLTTLPAVLRTTQAMSAMMPSPADSSASQE